ncbi:hypothetical protein BS50DRAFT_575417 [Corynespora cassiicola Philippines]|uniref:Uncharacterized protein n=1 Tax=Corynespora cassiicola Philippines TaxID=1448308 RepID=A0A2T2NIY8_CORCC|nr:hypothetical protein BS50DRAFT_575417 [Corynespora cassiicola Philippines]
MRVPSLTSPLATWAHVASFFFSQPRAKRREGKVEMRIQTANGAFGNGMRHVPRRRRTGRGWPLPWGVGARMYEFVSGFY